MQINTRKHGPERIRLTKREKQALLDAEKTCRTLIQVADSDALENFAAEAARALEQIVEHLGEKIPVE